jgi:hypothetical protein
MKGIVSVMPIVNGRHRSAYHVVRDVVADRPAAAGEAVKECLNNLEGVGITPEQGEMIELQVRFG